MKNIIKILIFFSLINYCYADQMNLIQLKLSTLGGINADTDDFDYYSDDRFKKYDMSFDETYSARIIYSGLFVSAKHSTTNVGAKTPDAIVESVAVGLASASDEYRLDYFNAYVIAGVGVGAGRFTFKQPYLNDWEAMVEINLEGGIELSDHLLLGVGCDYLHFGTPGETKAEQGELYMSIGLRF